MNVTAAFMIRCRPQRVSPPGRRWYDVPTSWMSSENPLHGVPTTTGLWDSNIEW